MDSKNQGEDNQKSTTSPNAQNDLLSGINLNNLGSLGNLGGFDLNSIGMTPIDPNLMNSLNQGGLDMTKMSMPTADLGALGNTNASGVDLSNLGNLFGGQDLNQILAGMGTKGQGASGISGANLMGANPQLGANMSNMSGIGNLGMPGLGLNLQNQSNSGGLMGQNGIQGMPNLQGLQNLGGGIGNLGVQPTNFDNLGLTGIPNMGMSIGNMGFNNSQMPQMGGMPPAMRNQGAFQPGSQQHQASFHQKGPDYEIKLFVGGLAFQTLESDLITYFKQYGVVADAIVMRDRTTQRGRGFGFVKMQFENKEKAQENKLRLLSINSDRDTGHYINDKRVDCKSADDYVKPQMGGPGEQMGGQMQQHQNYGQRQNFNQFNQGGQGFQPGMHQQRPPHQQTVPPEGYTCTKCHIKGHWIYNCPKTDPSMQNNMPSMQGMPGMDQLQQPQDPLMHVNKPNPWVIVEEKQENDGQGIVQATDDKPKEVVYKYPKSKIFVGGLDFKLTNMDLQQHFSQYGAIESAVILKNINNGQSRGFGFVTFKDEAVAQDLIQNLGTDNIHGRKVDIRSAEPKQQNSNQPVPVIPGRGGYAPRGGMNGGGPPGGFAMIPKYGDQNSDGSSRGSGREPFQERPRGEDRFRGGDRGGHYRGDYRDERDNYRGDRRRQDFDDRRVGRDREYRREGRRHQYRSDSEGSQESSSSFKNRRNRDKRGPHHGSSSKPDKEKPKDDGASKPKSEKPQEGSTVKNRSRSRSNR